MSELPPHPEATNRNVSATARFLTVGVCHPSPEGAGDIGALGVDTYSRSGPEVGGIPVALTDVALLTERLKVVHIHLPALGFRFDVVNLQIDAVLPLRSTGLASVLISLKYVITETPRNLGLLTSN